MDPIRLATERLAELHRLRDAGDTGLDAQIDFETRRLQELVNEANKGRPPPVKPPAEKP